MIKLTEILGGFKLSNWSRVNVYLSSVEHRNVMDEGYQWNENKSSVKYTDT